MEDYDVLILGGGASGLTALSTLLSNSPHLRVKVLEARRQIGGRIKSLDELSQMHRIPYSLEAGAEWIHGESHGRYRSLLYDSIKNSDAEDPLIEYTHAGNGNGDSIQECYHIANDLKGTTIDAGASGRLVRYPPYWDKDLEVLEVFIDNLWKYQPNGTKGTDREEVDGEESVADYFYKRVLKRIPYSVGSSESSTGENTKWRNHHLLEAWLGGEFGTSIDRLGMKSLAVSERLWRVGEKDYLLRHGRSYWRTLCDVFGWDTYITSSSDEEGGDNVAGNVDIPYCPIQTGTCATEVDFSGSTVVVSATSTAASRECTTQQQQQYRCRFLIVTVPLTMLKQRRIRFVPDLPLPTLRAIDRIGMDAAGIKIHIGFRECFWGDNVSEITLRHTTAFVWVPGIFRDDSRAERRERAKRETKNGKAKMKSGVATSATAESKAEPEAEACSLYVLAFMVTGSTAETMSVLDDDAKIARLLTELDLLFDGAASRSVEPSMIHVQDWGKEPFIEGCYSYPAPGSYRSATENDRVELARPVDGKLWFAGEAAALFHPATVLGAMEAGKRAAEDVLQILEHR